MKTELKITGMTCPHCEMRVKKALGAVPGVKGVTADHKKGIAVVELEKEVPVETLVKAVNDTELYKAKA